MYYNKQIKSGAIWQDPVLMCLFSENFANLDPKAFSFNDGTLFGTYEYFITSVYRNRTIQGFQQIIQSQVTHVKL